MNKFNILVLISKLFIFEIVFYDIASHLREKFCWWIFNVGNFMIIVRIEATAVRAIIYEFHATHLRTEGADNRMRIELNWTARQNCKTELLYSETHAPVFIYVYTWPKSGMRHLICCSIILRTITMKLVSNKWTITLSMRSLILIALIGKSSMIWNLWKCFFRNIKNCLLRRPIRKVLLL